MLVACDSRWSVEDHPVCPQNAVIVLDDSGFDKITYRENLVTICAGDLQLIDGWKRWIHTPGAVLPDIPPTSRANGQKQVFMQACLIDRENQRAAFYGVPYSSLGTEYFFGGTGRDAAMECFAKNFCGRTAVTSAGLADIYTGGATMFLELETGVNNLSTGQVTLADMDVQFLNRGVVMDKQTRKTTSLKDHLKQPQSAGLVAGGYSISAPCGAVDRPWTSEERAHAQEFARSVVARDSANPDKKKGAAND
jgi:hypothetical protein